MLIKYEQDGQTYAAVTGVVYSLKSRQTQKGKPMATFSVAYGIEQSEFGDRTQNKFMNCIAFASLAEYITSLDDGVHKSRVLACGKLQTNEYQGTAREEILCDFIIGQPIAETTIKRVEEQQQKEEDSWGDINF